MDDEKIAGSLGVSISYVPTSWPTLSADVQKAELFDFAIGGITITDVRQETLVSFWDAFLPAYLGTSVPTALREYTRKILAYYAVRVPFMFNLVHHDKFPEEGYKSLIGLIP